FILAGLVVCLLLSCSDSDDSINTDSTTSSSLIKIMPLGASRVQGARPAFESYRFELWKQLVNQNYSFDFIGTQMDDVAYPSFNGGNFDIDHEGRGSWTSGQILSELNSWINQTGVPDIVLFSSPGGNDALDNLPYTEAITNINAIIDLLQTANPNVTILIEQMAPGRTDIMTPQLTSYFTNMQQDVQTIAVEQSNSSSKVIAVDMFTGFTDAMLADEVHYNEAGAIFIANRYYNSLTPFLD
ncbi:MAG: hypothetical protein AAGH46_02410, partial [Bacteroidota bacterium]